MQFTLYSSLSHHLTPSSSWDDLLSSPTSQVLTSPDKASIWWVDVRDPSEEDVNAVAQTLSIHPLTIEDIVTRETREKVEVFRDYYLISFQTLVEREDDIGKEESRAPALGEVYILVFESGTVTFSPSGCGHVARVRERVRKLHDPAVLSSDWICYAIMYFLFLFSFFSPASPNKPPLTSAATTLSTPSPPTCKPPNSNLKP